MMEDFWTAASFLMLGIVLVFLEMWVPGYFIATPGGALFLGGALALAAPGLMFGPMGWFLWPVALVVATGANLLFYKRWAPPGKAPLTMTSDSLPGQEGDVEALVVSHNHLGKVRIRGTTWSARLARPGPALPVGTRARVVRTEGVQLLVEPVASDPR